MTKTAKAAPEAAHETGPEAAQPDPNQPTSNPPGGGRWTWSAATQAWQAVPDPEPEPAAA